MSLTLIRHPLARTRRVAPTRTSDARARARAWLRSVREERRGRVRVEPPIRGLWTAGGHAGAFGVAYLARRRDRKER